MPVTRQAQDLTLCWPRGSMTSEMDSAVAALLHSDFYNPCLLLVHPVIARLESATRNLLEGYGWPRLSIGQGLATALLSEPAAQRAYLAREWAETVIGAAAPGPLLLTEVDLLFEPALQLDVLALLRQASRTTRLVVAWPGTYEGGTLAYAVPQHRQYRTWLRPEVRIVRLN